MQQSVKIRVLVAHEDAIVRAGLAQLLSTSDALDVLRLDDGAAAPLGVHMIVTDYRDGLARVGASRANSGACAPANAHGQAHTLVHTHAHTSAPRVLIVTQLDREREVRSAMLAGVDGYLLQKYCADQLLPAALAVAQGTRYLSAELSCRIVDSLARSDLTNRESDVLQLLAQGCCNKLIARELGIGLGTVKTHVKGVFDKLGATARTHAVVLATRRGLIDDARMQPAGRI
jgi:DNA-binding NarL/FixJ family response regulator